jgi:hypothetical protein
MLRKAGSIASAFVLFLAATWSQPAAAVVVTGGFSGQIFSGFDFGTDPAGFFGAGVDLENLPITGTFRYDTAQVPPPSSTGANFAIYSDPTFSTDFLDFSVTINGRSYTFGAFDALPGIQTIDLIDNTDQLQFDYQRFGIDDTESLTLRFISDIDFLSGTGVPTQFNFVASGIGLTPGGFFSFDRANGDSVSAAFSIDSGFAQVVPEPATLSTLALGLLAIIALRRRAPRLKAATWGAQGRRGRDAIAQRR